MPSYRTVSISELTPGSVLVTAVFDKQHVKLLHAGAIVDQHLINRLQALGITEVIVDRNVDRIVRQPADFIGREVLPDENSEITVPIKRCGGCQSAIDIRAPTPELKASTWLCNKCGAVYFGGDDQGAELRGLTWTDPSTANPFATSVALKKDALTPSIPPDNVQRLAKSLIPEDVTWGDRRRHKRYPITVPVMVLPLAFDFRVIGEPIQMTTANVSLGGAALVHTRFLDAPNLALDFTIAGTDLLQLVLKVLRCRNMGPVYEIGGEFISRLSQELTK
jgi:hypothetical protein